MTLDSATRRFPAGEYVFREGDRGDCAYIVESGQVEISTSASGSRKVLALMVPGTLFGEMAVMDDVVRSADARTTQDSKLVVITREQLRQRIGESDTITQLLLRVLLERFRREIRLFRAPTSDALPVAEHALRHDVFNPGALEKMKLEGELRAAIQENQLELHFQPLVNMVDTHIAGFEALARWRHPERGLISPAVFVPMAEETALIVPMGRWVMEEACRWLARFLPVAARHGRPVDVAINISGRQLAEPDFLEVLLATVRQHGIQPQQLKLEITEGVMLDYPDAPAWIGTIKEAGFRVALDDFGTGYSSLGYLHRFPTDVLKLDKSFVQSMQHSPRSLAVVKSVIGLAHGLGMATVAEGIETAAEAVSLRGLSCEYGQGYLYSRPVPGEAALRLLDAGRALGAD